MLRNYKYHCLRMTWIADNRTLKHCLAFCTATDIVNCVLKANLKKGTDIDLKQVGNVNGYEGSTNHIYWMRSLLTLDSEWSTLYHRHQCWHMFNDIRSYFAYVALFSSAQTSHCAGHHLLVKGHRPVIIHVRWLQTDHTRNCYHCMLVFITLAVLCTECKILCHNESISLLKVTQIFQCFLKTTSSVLDGQTSDIFSHGYVCSKVANHVSNHDMTYWK